MTKNEIVARWMEWEIRSFGRMYKPNSVLPSTPDLEDYNLLHEAWVKFRDLKFEENSTELSIHKEKCMRLMYCITYESITEAFDELCKGIEWYNSLNNKEMK